MQITENDLENRSFYPDVNKQTANSPRCSPVWHLGLHTQTRQRTPERRAEAGTIWLSVGCQWTQYESLCCDPTAYLKTILLCKLNDGFPPFSGGVCCIKNLWNTKRGKYHIKTLTCNKNIWLATMFNIWPTATWPPFSARYCRTSFKAAEAHCL